MDKKCIFINCGWEQDILIQQIFDWGFDIYGIKLKDIELNQAQRFKAIYSVNSLWDTKELHSIIKKISPQMIISDQCDYALYQQSYFSMYYGLNGPNIRTAYYSVNKVAQRQCCHEKCISIPLFKKCETIDSLSHFLKQLGKPLVIKPVDNRGGFGVSIVKNESECKQAFLYALLHSPTHEVIAEQYIKGRHFSVDGYIYQSQEPVVLAFGENKKFQEGNSIVNSHIMYPAHLSDLLYNQGCEFVIYVCRALGYNFGLFHAELILDEKNNWILTEISNRGGGVGISSIVVPAVSGVDVYQDYINDCLNLNTSKRPIQVQRNDITVDFLNDDCGHNEAEELLFEKTFASKINASKKMIDASSRSSVKIKRER